LLWWNEFKLVGVGLKVDGGVFVPGIDLGNEREFNAIKGTIVIQVKDEDKCGDQQRFICSVQVMGSRANERAKEIISFSCCTTFLNTYISLKASSLNRGGLSILGSEFVTNFGH
jgi:hypothetical protein